MKTLNMDFYFQDNGSIILLTPLSKPAKNWTKENVYYEHWQLFGDSIAMEPRSFEEVFEGITDAEFRISPYQFD